jgi:transcription elongation factor GreA
METHYITKEKQTEMTEELAQLKSVKRKEIIEKLDYAKSLGDLSENAEYHQAREEQGKLEDRIRELEAILKSAVVVEKHSSSLVEIGATVTIQKEGVNEKKTYQIVGSQEADMLTNKISNNSPLGQALYGKKKGEIAEVVTPKGITKYKIVSIE